MTTKLTYRWGSVLLAGLAVTLIACILAVLEG